MQAEFYKWAVSDSAHFINFGSIFGSQIRVQAFSIFFFFGVLSNWRFFIAVFFFKRVFHVWLTEIELLSCPCAV